MNPIKTQRKYDINGWPEIKDNPISKVGGWYPALEEEPEI